MGNPVLESARTRHSPTSRRHGHPWRGGGARDRSARLFVESSILDHLGLTPALPGGNRGCSTKVMSNYGQRILRLSNVVALMSPSRHKTLNERWFKAGPTS